MPGKPRPYLLAAPISLHVLVSRLSQHAFAAALVAACSSTTPANPDAASPVNDATPADTMPSDAGQDGSDTSDDDATPTDGSITDATLAEGDGGCACSSVDSGLPYPFSLKGVLPMSCYCDMPWPGFGVGFTVPCMPYDDAIVCDPASRRSGAVITYANCDFVTVSYGSGSIDERHYDANTHEFVGARRGVDHDVPCGSVTVFTIQAGVLPDLDCQVAKIEHPCLDAGARDVESGDVDASDGG